MQPVRIQPDAHGVLGAELLHVRHAIDALNLVQHPRGEQVAQLVGIHAAVRGPQRHDDHMLVEAFCTRSPSALTSAGSRGMASAARFWVCTTAVSGSVPLSKVSVTFALPCEFDEAVKTAADGRYPWSCCSITWGDGVFGDLGIGARVVGRDLDLRRRDVRIGFDGQAGDRQDTRQGDQDGNHPGEDRMIYEESRHGGSASRRVGGQHLDLHSRSHLIDAGGDDLIAVVQPIGDEASSVRS